MKTRYSLSNFSVLTVAALSLLGTSALGSMPCLAQGSQPKKVSFSLKHSVPLSVNGLLQISLNDMPAGGTYIVGVTSQTAGPALVGEIVMTQAPAPMNHQIPSSLTDWTNVHSSPNTLDVNGLGSLQGTLMVFTHVPAGTNVVLDINGQLVSRVTSREDLIIQNGNVSTEPKVTMATLATKLMFPDSDGGVNLPEVIQSSPGVFVARPSAAVAHIVGYSLPSAAAADETVAMKINVDTSGNVTSVSTNAAYASDAFYQSCQETLWHWKFRPFYFGGKAVPVTTVVSFVSMQHIVQIGYTR